LQNDGEESIFRRFINLLFTKLMIIKSEKLRRSFELVSKNISSHTIIKIKIQDLRIT
jgi:hypothetical protein